MRIQFKALGFASGDALHEHTVRRLRAALSHWADRLGQVVVRIADVNGPRGGVDKVCSIQFPLAGRGRVAVAAVSTDYYSAVDLASRRAHRAAARVFGARPF